MMVLRSSPWSLPWEKDILMMLLTPFGVDLWNTLLYHLEALQLSFSPFFLCSFPTLSEGYNTIIFHDRGKIFTSERARQVLVDRLWIITEQAPPYAPSAKGTAETLFGWITERFERRLLNTAYRVHDAETAAQA